MKSIEQIIHHIKANPKIVGFTNIDLLKLLFSDYKKKSSEFHRILVEGNGITKRHWIKIVKNKPQHEIHHSLAKQYKIMYELWNFFRNNPMQNPRLSTCRPRAFLPEFNALITDECQGELMNRMFVRSLPLVHRRRIIEACWGAGVWLRQFHEFYRKNGATNKNGSFLTLCHTDYSPRNIFVSPGLVEAIDFVGVKEESSDYDIRFFVDYVQQARFNGLYWTGIKKHMVEAFLKGYFNSTS